MFKFNDRQKLQVKINVSVSLTPTRLSVSDIIWDYMCVCVSVWEWARLDGHARQLELHCSSSLAVINRLVSFPMVPFAWWRQSSPWRAPWVQAAIPSLLTCKNDLYTLNIKLVSECLCLLTFTLLLWTGRNFKMLDILLSIYYYQSFTDLSMTTESLNILNILSCR